MRDNTQPAEPHQSGPPGIILKSMFTYLPLYTNSLHSYTFLASREVPSRCPSLVQAGLLLGTQSKVQGAGL